MKASELLDYICSVQVVNRGSYTHMTVWTLSWQPIQLLFDRFNTMHTVNCYDYCYVYNRIMWTTRKHEKCLQYFLEILKLVPHMFWNPLRHISSLLYRLHRFTYPIVRQCVAPNRELVKWVNLGQLPATHQETRVWFVKIINIHSCFQHRFSSLLWPSTKNKRMIEKYHHI